MKDLIRFTLAIVAIAAIFAAVSITDDNKYELFVRAIGALIFGACVFAIYRIDNPKNKGGNENN